jgi:DNA-binding response OmpR family regulator
VADRNSEARARLVQLLREQGFQVDVADDLRALERHLGEGRGRRAVDLLVWGFDPRAPETELGATLLPGRARAVVLVTARGWLATAAAAQRLGASAVLRRPLDPEALRGTLRAVF